MKFIYAPIDNKNLMEDPFEDEVFGDFYAALDHHIKGARHLVGFKYEAYIDVSWYYGDNRIAIKVIATNPCLDKDEVVSGVFEKYKEIFKSWECEDNESLAVRFKNDGKYGLQVLFYFKTE